jgi:predicted acyltransferase
MSTEIGDVTSKPETISSPRLMSIDALRGFDMFCIVGGDRVARSFGAWLGTPEGRRFAEQFEHAEREGFRFYDLIFPLFLFLVGVVLPLSLRKYQAPDQAKLTVLGRIAQRVILLFLLGVIYNNGLQFRFESQRYTGVLQRIAICYGVAAVIFLLTKVRTQAFLFIGILLAYWAILTNVPSPETHIAGDLTKPTNLAGYIDRHYLPGKIYPSYYGFGDNEGLLSTIPAVATALLGVLAGQ